MQTFNLSPTCVNRINEMLILEMSKLAEQFPKVPDVYHQGSGRMTYSYTKEGSIHLVGKKQCATEANTKYIVDVYGSIGALVNAAQNEKAHQGFAEEIYKKLLKYAKRYNNTNYRNKLSIGIHYHLGHSAVSVTQNLKYGRPDFTSSFYD